MLPTLSCTCDDCREDFAKYAQMKAEDRATMMRRINAAHVCADAGMGYGIIGARLSKKEGKRIGKLFYETLLLSFVEFEELYRARGGK